MTEAIFGLIGVVTGALVTGWVTYVMARRQESAALRAALRLVGDEYGDLWWVLSILPGYMERTGDWPDSDWEPWRRTSRKQWEKHRDVLAARLTPADWNLIESGGDIHRSLQSALERRDSAQRRPIGEETVYPSGDETPSAGQLVRWAKAVREGKRPGDPTLPLGDERPTPDELARWRRQIGRIMARAADLSGSRPPPILEPEPPTTPGSAPRRPR